MPSISSLGGDRLVASLSFTHFVEFLAIEDASKRSFYEVECIRSNWSVRELKRQIGSLYYERSNLSLNKQRVAELAQQGSEVNAPKLAIRDPYVFEFLGLKAMDVMSESHLEAQLIDKLQDLLELGNGFCFEAKQKRILIGGEYFFIDLVFYHRILKCHVCELVSPERDERRRQPPIGILLCTEKNNALVEYALAGMDNQLFVSKYLLELPKKKEMQVFIERQVKELGENT